MKNTALTVDLSMADNDNDASIVPLGFDAFYHFMSVMQTGTILVELHGRFLNNTKSHCYINELKYA